MKKIIPAVLLTLCVLAAAIHLTGCKSSAGSTYLGVKVTEIETELNDLMGNYSANNRYG